MPAILHYSRNPNPRLAVAVARHLSAPVSFEYAQPFHPDHADRYRALNPSQLIPILEEPGRKPLWEADAIVCRLSMMVGANFWRMDDETPEMIRWISWGKGCFIKAMDVVHFEFGTKQRYGMGPVNWAAVDHGMADFTRAARQLDAHLTGRDWMLDGGLSYADFRMGTFLPFNDVTELPLDDYPALAAWAARLAALPAWAAPFMGLDAPALPRPPARGSHRRPG
jgi:glutathione S-transferase